ncbi:transglycosylase SLT domain-containing protein [Streptomyces sp. NPDC018026]|uniref:transglycosylase SLT domain-containing protein n=1 Tax=Streptomyces sp. NPDC018026 TaxID=3365031 RepID=UPI0037B70491
MSTNTGSEEGASSPEADQEGQQGGTKTARNAAIAVGSISFLFSPVVLVGVAISTIIICGLGILLAPLILLYLLVTGGGGSSDMPPSLSEASSALSIAQGDGLGDLDTSTVPEDLAEPIQNAGELCDVIGPVVIASQIQQESGFDEELLGPDGKKGISQLPPDVFDEYGKDDDDSGETTALDAEDSIMAQGRYMCDLADQAQELIDSGEAEGSVLDLALAGYAVGIDAVTTAGGLPATNEAQGYVVSVRAQFAKYEGIAAIPSDSATPTGIETPLPTAVPSESLDPATT